MALFDDAMFAPQSGIPGWLGELLAMAQVNPQQSQGFPQPMPQPRPDIQEMSARQQPQPSFGMPTFNPMEATNTSPAAMPIYPMGGQNMQQAQYTMQSGSQPTQELSAQTRQPQQSMMGPGGSLQSSLFQIAGILNPNLKHLSQGNGTDDIREYMFARQQGYKGTLLDWMAAKRGGAGEYGLQPVWGVGPDGKPAIVQLGKGGTAIQSKLPEGFNIQSKPIEVDGPTGTVLLDPQTRQQIGFIPKDHREAERQKEIGAGQGKAASGVHAAETTVNNAIATIEKLRKHPGIDLATGATGIIARKIPGTEAYNFDALNKQAQGNAFMAARESLKGAGQVTDFEGAKGEQAIANLDAAQTKKQYLDALDNLERMMKASVADLKKKAGIAAPTPPADTAPRVRRWNPATGKIE